ncbi:MULTISPECIES: type VI secretion system accessory protein TagJ [unclassified Azospirillum]|uniref:type VI secretion system accessory protein TagJ n=1 Tax=unclassified Azospirillum TaxID=2630922 RepID=UPI000B6D3253|nr:MULTISPECIES: type VI secretion system accessory protein TagJ [unclassified Azospirillum]SNS92415.1 type VI secretion system protein ImpE [Azospirillum sp. RU38E]SNT09349.1 type VI secretion system protein ImpE [Azospirillum sp. RU37A]
MLGQEKVAQLLKDGDVDAAMAVARDAVRSAPGAVAPRILMFQMLALTGEWARAQTQLKVIAELDAGARAMVMAYQMLVHSETVRTDIFAGKSTPTFLGQPEAWEASLVEALRLEGNGCQADALREKAFEEAPPSAGHVVEVSGEHKIAWIADCDHRLGPMLEIVIDGRYMWVAFRAIAVLEAEAPAQLCDLVWFPVKITFINGGQVTGYIPTRYPGTPADGTNDLLLSRGTDWRQRPDGVTVGLGQRMLATDQGSYALFDIRRIMLGSAPVATDAIGAGAPHG